jgi:acyl-CoA reductase-like NAD-dependent aldehyde dehydrogenase
VELPDRDPRLEALPGSRLRQHRVLKPAEDTPLLAQRFDLLHEAGLPEGVVQIVHGFGEEAGEALVRHPTPVITFTGSRETACS